MNDLAERIHNHNYRLDPFVRSLLDTDFYKLLMCNFAWQHFPDVEVSFRVKNRSVKKGRLCDVISADDLMAQLNHVRTLRFTEAELIWLKGNSFYGQTGIFSGEFIDFLRELRLPTYELGQGEGGDFEIIFRGTWPEVMLWEIYALAIINEARARAGMKDMSRYELKVLYSNATSKLVGKLKRLRAAGVPGIAEFGTRRRHGFLWQDFVLEAMTEELGGNFIGTSNALHAMRRGLPAIGTNAHELPMVMTALADLRHPGDEEALRAAQFDVLRLWEQTYDGKLLVALPDTYGTTQFLEAAEDYENIKNWRGFREDSKDPFIGGEEKIAFWKKIGVDPREKLQLFSDGLDVDQMIALHQQFEGRIQEGYGWGTLATNDFRGCDPRGRNVLDPISIVCKVHEVTLDEGPKPRTISAVKLSDNYEKATGWPDVVQRYRKVFGTKGVTGAPLEV